MKREHCEIMSTLWLIVALVAESAVLQIGAGFMIVFWLFFAERRR